MTAIALIAPVTVVAAAANEMSSVEVRLNVGQPVQLPEFFVPGQRIARMELPVPRGDLRPPQANLGEELLAIPGVFSQMRGSDAMEPNLRGLGFDRVATTLDGIPLINASPERTNSPVVILGGSAVTGMVVAKGLASVTLGPAPTGGRIELSTDTLTGGEPRSGGRVNVTYHSARSGWTSQARLTGVTNGFDATVTGFRDDLFDYRSADGRTVAARFDDHGESVSLGWRNGTQRAHLTVLHRRLRNEHTVSLPLDGKNTDATVLAFNYRWSAADEGAVIRRIEMRAGLSSTDPFITSEDRMSPPITAQAKARTAGGGFVVHTAPDETTALRLGADASAQRRRAVRTTTAGRDYIWPGVWYDDVGAFVEMQRAVSSRATLRLGARIDGVRSDADDADLPALGKPIRAQYTLYNGSDAARTARHNTAGAANVLFEEHFSPTLTAFAGSSYSVHPPQVMERYRAFLNALGGDGHGGNALELGNPSLRSERKLAIEAGVAVRTPRFDFESTVYAYHITDFILRTPIGKTEGPPRLMVIGYRNSDVDLYGAETGTTWKPASGWTLPLTLALAAGRNRKTGKGLAELPPWEFSGAIRHEAAWRSRPAAMEIGLRLVGARTNPAPEESPLFSHAGGFPIWHARAGLDVTPQWRLECGLENALNRAYTEYLNPPVAPIRPATGDLQPGERVPAPGRSWWVSVSKQW